MSAYNKMSDARIKTNSSENSAVVEVVGKRTHKSFPKLQSGLGSGRVSWATAHPHPAGRLR